MSRNRFLAAALAAAARGWFVFPLVPGGKIPTVRDWESRATTERGRIHSWWAGAASNNVGIAAGKSGLVVIDLDGRPEDIAPERFAGARHGRDVLAVLAAAAGSDMPTNTYTVATPGGCHLYYRAPREPQLRNTAGTLGWRIDTRAWGGYVVAAGSRCGGRSYRLTHRGPVAELPGWLAHALTPPPSEPTSPLRLPPYRADAYVRTIVDSETRAVAAARTGTRHHALLKAARTLGRLVGGGELTQDEARQALLTAAVGHIGVDDCTADEIARTVADGIAYGKQLPRQVTRDGEPTR